MISLDLLGVAVFASFFAGTALAIYLAHRRWIRATFLSCFFAASVVIGLTGGFLWPFFGWGLYAQRAQETIAFYELRVADREGNEIKLDARAAPPSLATPLNRLAAKIAAKDANFRDEVSRFLLIRARSYRHQVERDGSGAGPLWKFPPHQGGVLWTRAHLASLGRLQMVRVYRVEAHFSEDGTRLLSRSDRLITEYRDERE